MRTAILVCVRLPTVVAVGLVSALLWWPAQSRAQQQSRPNIVVVLVDDMRWDEYGAAGHFAETPNIDRLAREGATFTRAYHVTPLCSPNRASLLTGQYPSRHGIRDNVARSLTSHGLRTFPQALQELGYETAFVGKWHMGNDPTPRPGFDEWVSFAGQGRTVDPEVYEDGRLHEVRGYVTDILTDRSVDFIEAERERPFLLYLSHKAIHPDAVQRDDGSVDVESGMRFVPAPRHAGRYENTAVERAPSYLPPPALPAGKSVFSLALERKRSHDVQTAMGPILDPGTSDETIRRRAEMLLAVDEGLGRILDALDARGQLENTMVVFTSDNGYFFGEHGASIERRLPYEEAVRSPLIVRHPATVAPGTEVSELVLSVDVAPTLIDVAGGRPGDHIQGRSWLPLLRGDASGWREAALLEYYSHEQPMPWMRDLSYKVVNTGQFKLVHWLQHHGADELYDLEADPYEMDNLAGRPEHGERLAELRSHLDRLVAEVFR